MTARGFRTHGWDPVLLLSEIIALQALHYLTLSLMVPPLLALFADPLSLSLEGGSANVAMIVDWRPWTGKATIEEHVGALTSLPAGWGRGRRVSASTGWAANARLALQGAAYGSDPLRGWLLGFAWIATSLIDILYLYHLVRRPTYILDFSLTLLGIHLVLTTYFASSFPTSIFFWIVIIGSSVVQIVWAEQLCIRREMRDGFVLPTSPPMGGNGERRNSNIEQSSEQRTMKQGQYEAVPMHDMP